MRFTTLRATGPERITPEWWFDDPAWRTGLRDYWRIETQEGPRLWLFVTPQAAPDLARPGGAQNWYACRGSSHDRPDADAELCVTSNFTFLTGASHPEELVTRAAELGLAAIAITDRNSVAGVVRAFRR
jgi:hypothetical protein